jgi:hypothetical protein
MTKFYERDTKGNTPASLMNPDITTVIEHTGCQNQVDLRIWFEKNWVATIGPNESWHADCAVACIQIK